MRKLQRIIDSIINPIVSIFNNKATNAIVDKCTKSPWVIFIVSIIITLLIVLYFNLIS